MSASLLSQLVAGLSGLLLLVPVCSFFVGPGVPYQLDPAHDWLVHPEVVLQTRSSFLAVEGASASWSLSNGLISRTFITSPNFATVGYRNLITQLSYFRAPKPEAMFTVLDGTVYTVGGVAGAENNEALWQPYYYTLSLLPNAFTYVKHSVEPAKARFAWRPQRWSEVRSWPPAGVRVNVDFAPPSGDTRVQNLTVRVVYEMYDGIPVLQKYVQISNSAEPDVMLSDEDGIHLMAAEQDGHRHRHTDGHDHTVEHSHPHLAPAEHSHSHAAYAADSQLRDNPLYPLPSSSPYINSAPVPGSAFVTSVVVELLACPEHACDRVMDVETDYMPRHTHWDARWTQDTPSLNTTLWFEDAEYNACCDNNLQADGEFYVTLLQAGYPNFGPSVLLAPGAVWDSFHVIELCHDSEDEERQNLGRRRWMRTLSPQGTENPIYWHLEEQSNIINAIDQTAAAGMEMVIMSFGSGFNAESSDPSYLAFMANATAYAHSKDVLIGGYTLMQNPNYFPWQDQAIDPSTGRGLGIACFATEGHRHYRQRLIDFVNATGIDMLETDGPFEGALCAATGHAYHRGAADSQAAQDYMTQDFYRSLKVKDIYFTVPDPYWLSAGTNKEPIGYTDRWTGSSFDKWERLAIGRMYSYDGTTHYPPTMGWMVFNYENYSPLNNNQQYYELALAQYLGNGIVTCFRGHNLYDSDQTLALTRHWVMFYRQHRTVLNGDVLHIVRPTGQDIDLQMHVSPLTWPFSVQPTDEIALGFLFNPTPDPVKAYSTRLNLYYAGSVPGDQVSIEWGSGIVRPWQVQATTGGTVDESFGLAITLGVIPPYQFAYFIITPA